MREKFHVEFLPEAVEFIENINSKAREKILYNIRKTQFTNDRQLFKKLTENIWEFRTLFGNICYRIFAFWDKTANDNVLVVATHGMIKKSEKIPRFELKKAEKVRLQYFKQNDI